MRRRIGRVLDLFPDTASVVEGELSALKREPSRVVVAVEAGKLEPKNVGTRRFRCKNL